MPRSSSHALLLQASDLKKKLNISAILGQRVPNLRFATLTDFKCIYATYCMTINVAMVRVGFGQIVSSSMAIQDGDSLDYDG